MVCPGSAGDFRADGIAVDVDQGFEKMALIESAGVETVLPEMAAAFVAAVGVLGVKEVGSAQSASQRIGRAGDGDEVNMVAHQAITEDVKVVLAALVAQEFEVDAPVLIVQEHILAVIAALGDVVGDTGDNNTCDSGHERVLHENGNPSKQKLVPVPSFLLIMPGNPWFYDRVPFTIFFSYSNCIVISNYTVSII